MTMYPRRGRALLVVTVLTAPLGCREPTEAVVEISTNGECTQVYETGITPGPLGDIETRDYATVTSSCDGGDIGSIVLYPPDKDREAPFAFKIVTSLGKPVDTCVAPAYGQHCIVSRRAMRFVPHHAFTVPVRMSVACAGVICPADQSCVDGVCHSATVDPEGCDAPDGCEPPPAVPPPFTKQFGGTGQELARYLALGDDGTLAFTGNFDDTLDFGTGAPLVSKGGSDVFLASFTPAGEYRWSASFGGKGFDEGSSIAIDAHGSIYLLASYEDKITFGGDELVSKGGTDVALVKFTSFGKFLWQRSFEGSSGEVPGKVAVDSKGNVYLTVEFDHTTKVAGTELESAGGTDVLLASFDSAGNLRWAKSLGGPGNDGAGGVGTDAAGNIYLAGYFQGQAEVGAPAPLTSVGSADAFVASFDGEKGGYRWAKSFGSPSNDIALDLRARGSRVVVTGSLAAKATLDGVALPAKNFDGFVLALDTDGKLDWSRVFGGEGTDQGSSIDISPDGQSIVLGGDTFSGNVFESAPTKLKGVRNPFVAVLNADGSPRWSKTFPSSLFATSTAVAAPNDGFAFLAGWFDDKLTVDDATLASKGRDDMMLLRIAAPTPPKPVPPNSE